MGPAQILGVRCCVAPILQAKADLKLHARHRLQARQHKVRADRTVRDHVVVMRPLIARKDRPMCYGVPEPFIITRSQPVLHILNVFKHSHEGILPNLRCRSQI